jgi:hypothetical protein
MIIDIPFRYSVRGIEPRCRNPSDRTGYDQVRANIRDVHESDAPVALVLLDQDGGPAEIFRHFDGCFWIRDAREHDTDFGKQHIMLTGSWPKKSQLSPGYLDNARHFKAYTKDEANRDNEIACRGLSLVGLLRFITTAEYSAFSLADKDSQLRSPFYQGPTGVDCAVVDPTVDFRQVTANDVSDRRQTTVEYAQSTVVAINGELWHRSPIPMIYATDKDITWAFNGSVGRELDPNQNGYQAARQDMAIVGAYKMSMTEYDTIPDVFPDAIEKQRVKFYIDYIDASYFDAPDIKPLVVKDIKQAVTTSHSVLNQSTPYVYKWLELRDLVQSVNKDLDNQGDTFYDTAAELMLELDAMLGRSRYPGAAMWLNRKVEFNPLGVETPKL